MAEILREAIKHNWAFWLCLLVSIGLNVGSFFVPPCGVIDGSCLAATGELFAFAALANISAAISKGIDAKVEHNGTSITVGNLEKEERHQPYADRYKEEAFIMSDKHNEEGEDC